MTSVIESDESTPPLADLARRRLPVERLGHLLRRRRTSLAYLVPLLLATGAARLVNLGGFPQRTDAEGTHVARAYAVEKLGELARYTVAQDPPPLGSLQISAWTSVTDAFDRHATSVAAGREAMVVASIVSAALLWLLARRVGLGRPASAAVVLLFALSPLSIELTRTVHLDNLATPWLLAAFVLALSTRRQLPAFAGAAVCFSVATLSGATVLLLLPFLAWQLVRSADPGSRRATLPVAGLVLVVIAVGYGLYSDFRGGLLPFRGGGPFDTAGGADSLLAAVVVLAAVAGLLVHRLRPYAAALLLLAVVARFEPASLPAPTVIVMAPFAALLVAGVLEAGLRHVRPTAAAGEPASRTWHGRAIAGTSVAAAVLVLAVAAGSWPGQLRDLWTADPDRPLREAQAWVLDNVGSDDRILVDDAVWTDLVSAGLGSDDVVWYAVADTDPDVIENAPEGWRDYDYVLVTDQMRRSGTIGPIVDAAVESSVRVAAFGSGATRVDILRVLPGGTRAFSAASDRDEQSRMPAGQALLSNTSLEFTPEARERLEAGQVDARVLSLLALLSGEHRLSIADFPAVYGEDGRIPLRTVSISAVDDTAVVIGGVPVDQVAAIASDQVGSYVPTSVEVVDNRLMIQYSLDDPQDLLPAPAG